VTARIVAVIVAVAAAGCPKPLPRPARQPLFGEPGTTGTTGPSVGARVERATPATPPPAPGDDARAIGDGVVVETIEAGTGTPPVGNDRVTVQFHSWAPEMAMSELPQFVGELPKLPTGISAAVKTMSVGEHARVWVPAVDTKGRDADPIVVDIRLISVQVAPPIPADVAAPPANAKTTKSGVASVVLEPGTGKIQPTSLDEVVVIYTAWNSDGSMVETTTWDYSPTRTWTVNRFGVGLADALTQMVVGEKARFWIPIKLTNWNDDTDSRLTYDIELVELHQQAPPPKTPKDVAKPPAGAKKTAKGVRYRFLTRGTSKVHPGPRARVKVNYTGWTTDGRMFDSSVARGTPAVFPLDAVIAGWTDVMQVMAPGDKLRAWIPEDLAYKGQSGKPPGTLVFDIELLEVYP